MHRLRNHTAVRVGSEAVEEGGIENNKTRADFSESPFSTCFKLDSHQVGYGHSVSARSVPEKLDPDLAVPQAAATMQRQ